MAHSATPAFDQRKDADLVVLRLPSPISVNAIWSPRGGGGVRLSDPYRAWLREAGYRLSSQRPGRIAGRYDLTIRLPAESNIDIDNGIKVLSDFLEKNGVIRNDRDDAAIHICRQSETEDAIVEVRPFVANDMTGGAMKPSSPTVRRVDPTLADEVLGLWEGGFDTAVIAEVLTMKMDGPPVTEAEVYNILSCRPFLPPKPAKERRAVPV